MLLISSVRLIEVADTKIESQADKKWPAVLTNPHAFCSCRKGLGYSPKQCEFTAGAKIPVDFNVLGHAPSRGLSALSALYLPVYISKACNSSRGGVQIESAVIVLPRQIVFASFSTMLYTVKSAAAFRTRGLFSSFP